MLNSSRNISQEESLSVRQVWAKEITHSNQPQADKWESQFLDVLPELNGTTIPSSGDQARAQDQFRQYKSTSGRDGLSP